MWLHPDALREWTFVLGLVARAVAVAVGIVALGIGGAVVIRELAELAEGDPR